jgi:hypothetical protein
MDAARPSWTQSIDATASDAPERALVGTPTTEFTRPVNPGPIVRVHVAFLDILFGIA